MILAGFAAWLLNLHGKTIRAPEQNSPCAVPRQQMPTHVIEFLNREGRTKQFFPEYRVEDFGCPGGLLPHLEWKDVFLALRGPALVGMLAAWDQQTFPTLARDGICSVVATVTPSD